MQYQLYARRISSWSLVRNQFFSKISIYYQRSPLPCWSRRGTDGAAHHTRVQAATGGPAHLACPATVYTWLHLARQWVVAAPGGRMSSPSSLSQPQHSLPTTYLLSEVSVECGVCPWIMVVTGKGGMSCLVLSNSRMCDCHEEVTSVLHLQRTSVQYLKHKQVQFSFT